MTTAPWEPRAESMVRQSLEHRQLVTVQPVDQDPFSLDVEDLEISFSEDWAPHVEVSLSAAMPQDQAQLDALDPRAGCRLLVSAGYVYPDRTPDIHQLADVALDTREVTRPDNQLKLTAVSAEVQLQDYRSFWNPRVIPATGLPAAIRAVLAFGLQPKTAKVNATVAENYGAAHLAGIEAPLGTTYWDVAEDAAARTDAWVYCDGANTWQVTTKPQLAGKPAHALTVGQGGTLISTNTTLSRQDWANAVILTYDWTDANNVRRTVYGRALASSGAYATSAVGFRTHQENREIPVTQAQANRAAEGVLRNLISRGRGYTLDAVAAYWLRPGMTVSVQLPTGEPELHLVRSVRFRPGTGTMTLTTRQPQNVTITTGE